MLPPDGTGEFLDAWLMLLEKMVNTKNVLDSPHTLPAKSTQTGFVPFSPVQYLIHTHKVGTDHYLAEGAAVFLSLPLFIVVL